MKTAFLFTETILVYVCMETLLLDISMSKALTRSKRTLCNFTYTICTLGCVTFFYFRAQAS